MVHVPVNSITFTPSLPPTHIDDHEAHMIEHCGKKKDIRIGKDLLGRKMNTLGGKRECERVKPIKWPKFCI